MKPQNDKLARHAIRAQRRDKAVRAIGSRSVKPDKATKELQRTIDRVGMRGVVDAAGGRTAKPRPQPKVRHSRQVNKGPPERAEPMRYVGADRAMLAIKALSPDERAEMIKRMQAMPQPPITIEREIGRCHPPEVWAEHLFHWLIVGRDMRQLSIGIWRRDDSLWVILGAAEPASPEDLHRNGWTWLAPAIPPVVPPR